MADLVHIVVFTVEGRRFALPLEVVDRVVRAVHITPLPRSPALVLGIINVHGKLVPVIDLRERCGVPQRETQLTDHFILTHTATRDIALRADHVEVVACPREKLTPVSSIVPEMQDVQELVDPGDGLLVVYNIALLLSKDEECGLQEALGAANQEGATSHEEAAV